jgi:HD superfamily phosphohydrolase
MSTISFADVAHQSITLSTSIPAHRVILQLIDTAWVQRLRDISQTANTRLVYMFSEHSRFGHCLGVAHLAVLLLDKLRASYPEEVDRYSVPVAAAALLHDVGHLAPGSHTAFKTWFPEREDTHEEISARIISSSPEIQKILTSFGENTLSEVLAILSESQSVPPWTWEIISGGGWNVDRGNWCIVDSILAGVSYGKYNVPALTESMTLTPDGHLALSENRLDAMTHFAVSRHAMYRQLYQHRVILASDVVNQAIALRARDLGAKLPFADDAMKEVLASRDASELSLATIDMMREPWWRYHLLRWRGCSDPILSDLASRLIDRRLFKTWRVLEGGNPQTAKTLSEEAVRQAGFDPRYYLSTVSTAGTQGGDSTQSMKVLLENGGTKSLADADPLLKSLMNEDHQGRKIWIVLPAEAKKLLS